MIKIFLILIIGTLLIAKMTDHTLHSSQTLLKHIKILDSKELHYDSFNGGKVKELSALAYKDGNLYALGDKGVLCHFHLDIQKNSINQLVLKNAMKLKDEDGKALKKSHRDSEGLVFKDKDLLISFERKPRVHKYSTLGIKIKKQKIHKDLRNKKNYRSENKALEAVAYSKEYGLITAPEKSLDGMDKDTHTLYSKTQTWNLPAQGSITALEFMSKNKIMILQRKHNSLTRRRIAVISSLNLKTLDYQVLAKLDTKNGWDIDNFEGLTKVSKGKYLMISDNNDSFFQKTLLVFFEVL